MSNQKFRVVNLMPYELLAVGLSDVGLVRQNNEDVWAQLNDLQLFILADGMGGHQAGEIAAKEAVAALSQLIRKAEDSKTTLLTLRDAYALVRQAIEQTNRSVYLKGQTDAELRGMGTTLCCLYFQENGLIYGHVGDSRIYRLRKNRLEQLTKDHSLLRELVDMGELDEEQSTDFLYKNIITKAIGTEPDVDPTIHASDIAVSDIYLMCSDGLSDLLPFREIERILNTMTSLEEGAQTLIKEANEKGGHDNITVVLVKVLEHHESKDLS